MGLDNLGLTELLIILGACAICLLPVLVVGVAAVIIAVGRRRSGGV
jgi:hypothetical protein